MTEIKGARLGDPLSRVLQNFELSNSHSYMDKIFGMGIYQKQTKRIKNWRCHDGDFPQTDPPKFKLFNLLKIDT